VLALLVGGLALVRAAGPAITLHAAGATFPYPVYEKWFEAFRARNPEIEVHYDPVGSEAGLSRLEKNQVDFAASDAIISAADYFAGGKPKYLRFPTVLGAVVPVYNLTQVPRDLRFTPQILADIYLGKITKWNDRAIRRANPAAVLPDKAIVVVHRSDGSGSTYVWTDYLSKVSEEWKSGVGVSSSPKWPAGTGAEGNEGMAKMVRDTPNSIGYAEYIYAIEQHLSYGSVRNIAGKYVSPDLESIAGAADGASNRIAEDFQTSITNAAGSDAWPIASFSWFIVPAKIDDREKKKAILELLRWVLGPGQKQAAALGYLSIPQALLAREQRALDSF
jgi:phosphate transport system substrate-binding protein